MSNASLFLPTRMERAMKCYLLSALLVIICYTACKKDNNAPPASKGLSSQVDSVSSVTAANTPVAKYIGTLIDSATYGSTCDAPGPEYDINTSFVYCITNIKNDSLVFWMQTPLEFVGFDSAVSIWGAFPKNIQNVYGSNPLSNSFTYKISNDSLYVHSHYSKSMIWYDYSGFVTISFAGKLQPFDTASVQTDQRKR